MHFLLCHSYSILSKGSIFLTDTKFGNFIHPQSSMLAVRSAEQVVRTRRQLRNIWRPAVNWEFSKSLRPLAPLAVLCPKLQAGRISTEL